MSENPDKKSGAFPSDAFQREAFQTDTPAPGLRESPGARSPRGFLRRADARVRGAILKLLPFLARVPRGITAGIAAVLILFGAAHEWRTPPLPINSPPPRLLRWTWWATPRQLNSERTLLAFDHAIIESVETVPGSKRVWIAGDAGLLAYSDDDGANWTTFHYDPITGTMMRDVPVAVATLSRLITWDVEAAQSPAQRQQNTNLQAARGNTSAEIRGTVTDASGATIDGVDLTVTNVDTGYTRTLKSGSDGRYNFPDLPLGAYRLRAVHAGFKSREQTGIVLHVKDILVIDLVLQVGAVSETVTVQAAIQPLTTTQTKKPSRPAPAAGLQALHGATPQVPPKEPPNWVNLEFFAAGTLLVSSGGAYVLYSSDLGTTWTSHIPPTIAYPEVRGPGRYVSLDSRAQLTSGTIGETVSNAGFVFHDGAEVWSQGTTHQLMRSDLGVKRRAPVEAQIHGIAGAEPNQAWAAGEQSDKNPVIYHSADEGQTWALQYPNSENLYPQWKGAKFGLRDISFREDAKTGFTVGTQGAILRTRDEGQHWQPITRGAAAPGKLASDYRWWQQPVRIPAPLSLLMFLLGLALLVPAVVPETVPHVVEQTIASVTVSDAPVISPTEDTLGFAPVGRAISGLLRNKGTKLPITLAITAKWGRGKTSLMSMVQQHLKAAGWRTVWFNAWHHQEELSLLAALLQTVRQKAPPMLLERGGIRYRVKLVAARLLHWQTLWFAAACFVLYNSESAVHERHPHMYGCTAQYLYERSGGIVLPGENLCTPAEATSAGDLKSIATSSESEKKAVDKPGILEFLMRLLFDAARKAERLEESTVPGVHTIPLMVLIVLVIVLGWQVLQSFAANPAELLTPQTARQRVSELEARTSFLEKFRKQYGDVVEALGRYRLVILIDDLDRCRPEKISEMLEAANYLMAAGPCALVMALEEEAVIAGLGLSFQRMAEELVQLPRQEGAQGDLLAEARNKRLAFGQHYVEKLLNVVVQVPVMDPDKFTRVLAGSGRRPEPAGERRTRRIRRFAEVARVPAAGIVLAAIIFVGGNFLTQWLLRPAPPPHVQVAPPAVQPNPSAPTPTKDSRSVNTGTTSAAVPGPQPTARPVYAKAIAPLPQRWFSQWWQRAAWALVLVAFVAALLARRPPPVTTDSAEFLNALRLWAPVLAEANPSPRAAKRLLNRLRYLAMLEREAAKEPDTKVMPIPEPLLVALGALDVAAPGSLARQWELAACWLASEKALKPPQGMPELAWSTLRNHKSVFNTGSNDIPAAQFNNYCQRFVDLSAGIVTR